MTSKRTNSKKGALADRLRHTAVAISVGVLIFAPLKIVMAQDEQPPPGSELKDIQASNDNASVYFADVLVKGRPVFQIGSLGNISAADRAAIINRRIASLVEGVESGHDVSVQMGPNNSWATLRANNRVLMTVTQQDADDFGLSVDELAERRSQQLNSSLREAPLLVDATQLLGSTVNGLARDTIRSLPSLLGAGIVIGVTWGVAGGVRRVFYAWAERTESNRSSEILIARLGYGGVWVIGSVIALGVMGLEFGALLGALGLTSVAVGFSLKDVLSNYISGVILLAARPFRLGDQVSIDDYEGTVTEIQLRATTIRTYDGRMVYIPNQEVFKASVTNNTASPIRRSSVIVGIDYEAEIEAASKAIVEAIKSVDSIQQQEPSPPRVLVRELAASTVNLEVQFWVNSHRGEFLETTSRATKVIKESLEAKNIDMPLPASPKIPNKSAIALKEEVCEL
ncbi:MAG: mechanosensitive ion channel family protein, partial [Cyanobacteria bacterium P01_G01_bin.4]